MLLLYAKVDRCIHLRLTLDWLNICRGGRGQRRCLLIHLHYSFHRAVLINEEHDGVFASGDNFSVEVSDFHEFFSACTKLVNSGEVQGKV